LACAERHRPRTPEQIQPPYSSRGVTVFSASGLTIYHMVQLHRNDLFTDFVAFSRDHPVSRPLRPGACVSTGQTSANLDADSV